MTKLSVRMLNCALGENATNDGLDAVLASISTIYPVGVTVSRIVWYRTLRGKENVLPAFLHVSY